MNLYKYLRIKTAADTAEKTLDQYQAEDLFRSAEQNGTRSRSYYYNPKDDPANKISWKKRLAAMGIGAALGTGATYNFVKYMGAKEDPISRNVDRQIAAGILPLSALYGTVGYRLARRAGLGRLGKSISAGVGAVLPGLIPLQDAYDPYWKRTPKAFVVPEFMTLAMNLGAPLAGAWLANDFLKK